MVTLAEECILFLVACREIAHARDAVVVGGRGAVWRSFGFVSCGTRREDWDAGRSGTGHRVYGRSVLGVDDKLLRSHFAAFTITGLKRIFRFDARQLLLSGSAKTERVEIISCPQGRECQFL